MVAQEKDTRVSIAVDPLPTAVREALAQAPVKESLPVAVREEVISVPIAAHKDALPVLVHA